MTPCEKRNWKEGQVFEVTQSEKGYAGLFLKGALIILDGDLSSAAPRFVCIQNANPEAKNGGGIGYITLKKIKRIYPPEELSKDVEVVCEGKSTTISRESAEKLNLL